MKRALIPAVLLLVMLSGCGEKEEETEISTHREREPKVETEEPTPTEEPEDPEDPGVPADPEVEGYVEYLPLTLEDHHTFVYDKDIEYKTRFEGGFDELVINCDDYYALKYSIGELNDNIKNAVEQAQEDYMEYAYEDSGFDDNWSYYYYRTCDASIDRADTNVVSVSLYWGDFAGGVHPNNYYETHVYDTQSGKSLALDDIIDTSKKPELLKLVGERALESNPDLEDMLFNDIDTAIQDLDENYTLSFSLGRDGLSFYFSPYEIAAYAAGGTVATIGYDEIPGLIKDEYKVLPSDYILPCMDESVAHTLSDGRKVECNAEFDNEDGLTFHIIIDGKDHSFDDYGYQSWFYLAEKNGNKFVLRETQHDNDYENITVYDINGDEPRLVSETWASLTGAIFNPNCMTMQSRGDMFSTYSMSNIYTLENNGEIRELKDYYMISRWGDDWSITMKQDFEAEGRNSFDTDVTYTMFLKKGDKLKFYATDDETYVDFLTEEGDFVRIYIDEYTYPQTVNGIDIDDLFDGIMFAG